MTPPPREAAAGPIVWLPAAALRPYLEHDGGINDEEFGDHPGAYLAQLADMDARLDPDSPAVLVVDSHEGTASLSDGNHRLLLTLQRDPHELVPVCVSSEPSSFPGVPYDGCAGWPSSGPQRAPSLAPRKSPGSSGLHP